MKFRKDSYFENGYFEINFEFIFNITYGCKNSIMKMAHHGID
jgi:hypothetical protein